MIKIIQQEVKDIRKISKLYNFLQDISSSIKNLNNWIIDYRELSDKTNFYTAHSEHDDDLKVCLVNNELFVTILNTGALLNKNVFEYLIKSEKSIKISLLINDDSAHYKTFSSLKSLLFKSLSIFDEENFEVQLIHLLELATDFEELFSKEEISKMLKIQKKLEDQLTKLLGK